MYTGPKLTNDNLVFGYDTGYGIADNGTATRFCPGEPTTNLYTNSDFSNGETGWTFGSWHNNSVTHTATTLLGPYGETVSANKLYIGASSTATHFHQYNQSKYASGSTYTTSAWVKGSGTFQIKSHWGGNTSFTMTGDWQRVSMTVTATSSASNNFPYFAGESLTTGTNFYITMCQTELNAHETPYVYSGGTTGSRSDTASLIDLKKTRDINVSNVSFDSDSQPEFDGTDDFIPVNNLLASQAIGATTQLTISMWLNPDTHSDDMAFSTGQSGNDRIYHWTTNGVNTWRVNGYTSTTGHGTLPAIGNWYNTVLVLDGLSIRVYLNGVEDYTASYTAFTTEHYATFGRHGASSSYYYNGKIAVARIHDEAMSAEEIKSNFNAYKNRFNL